MGLVISFLATLDLLQFLIEEVLEWTHYPNTGRGVSKRRGQGEGGYHHSD